MFISLNWLKEYVDLEGISENNLRLKMSGSGLSVERQETVGEGLEDIVVGKITERKSHPNSDHLWICQVQVGENEYLQIVTGAQNIEQEQFVPVVKSGGKLPNGMAIEATTLRGVQSNGMLCSAKELGVGEDHSGILILDGSVPVGASFAEGYGFPDMVFDVEITPNRGDLLSLVGVAREISVLFDRPLIMPRLKSLSQQGDKALKTRNVFASIEDKRDCDRFSVAGFAGDFSIQTPFYIQQRLLRAGMRPLALLVDISNYVMLELGQPNHAYDASLISGGEFFVRRAHFGEKLTLLDGSDLELDPHMLVIADPNKVIGLAGIMGGKYSGIGDETTDVLVEAAHFDGVQIRKTTMKTNIRSEASSRFEKKVDPALTLVALERFHQLLSELTSVTVCCPIVDENHVEYQARMVTLTAAKLKMYMGRDFALNFVENILNNLGFETAEATHAGEHGGWHITVMVPSWRMYDVSIEEDLIEEVARIYGYTHIESVTPKGHIPNVVSNLRLENKKKIINSFVARGWTEVLTYSFNSEEQIKLSGYDTNRALKVTNALSEEHSHLRLSLLPNLFNVVFKNIQSREDLRLFECSRVYHQKLYPALPAEIVNEELEKEYVGMVLSDKGLSLEMALAEMQSMLHEMLSLTKKSYEIVQNAEVISSFGSADIFHPGRVAAVLVDHKPVGLFGQIHPKILEFLKLDTPIFAAEIDAELSNLYSDDVVLYKPFSIYPRTVENIAFLVNCDQSLGDVIARLNNLDDRIVGVSIADRYFGEELPEQKFAVTLEVVYQKMNEVISHEEASKLRTMIIDSVKSEFGLEYRY